MSKSLKKIIKNKGIAKLLTIVIIIIILATALVIWVNNRINNKYKDIINIYISNVLENVKEEYPNVNQSDLIKILNNKNITANKKMLENYGIINEQAIKALEQKDRNNINYNLLILIVTCIAIIIAFYNYLKYRQKEIDKITEYVEKVSNKQYSLDINENSEDELSSLKNELYKVTVMLKEEADNSKKQKEALSTSISDISHQLKTPLTSILIMLDNLRESDNMDQKTRCEFISEISRQIENMNWLVISLLKLSRLDAGVVEFEKDTINANKLVNEIISNLEIVAELKNVNLEVQASKECYFEGDYNWNKEAIQNIVKNAIEHTKVNTKVKLLGDGIEDKNTQIELAKTTDKVPMGFEGKTTAGYIIVSDEWIQQKSDYYLSNGIELYINCNNSDVLEENIKKIDKNINITNIDSYIREQKAMWIVIAIFLYGFITVISLIGVTNIFNTITTNMNLRSKEFANLKSIGMTTKEFNKMIRLESIFYGTKSLLIGIPIGLGLSYLMFKAFGESVDFGFIFPVSGVLISIIAVFVLIISIMKYSLNKINKQNIIELS